MDVNRTAEFGDSLDRRAIFAGDDEGEDNDSDDDDADSDGDDDDVVVERRGKVVNPVNLAQDHLKKAPAGNKPKSILGVRRSLVQA